LTNAARAEVEQTLEWARAQAAAIMDRAQHGAEQLLAAAGLGQEAIGHVAAAIVEAAGRSSEQARSQPPAAALSGPAPVVPPVSPPAEPPVSPPQSAEEPASGEEQPDSES
jgi:hypothetical protein